MHALRQAESLLSLEPPDEPGSAPDSSESQPLPSTGLRPPPARACQSKGADLARPGVPGLRIWLVPECA